MNVVHVFQGVEFEWDRRKAATSLRKHGVSFETACEVFFDPFVASLGPEDVDGELRDRAVGMTTGWQLLVVVYLLRADRLRLISARECTPPERSEYENR